MNLFQILKQLLVWNVKDSVASLLPNISLLVCVVKTNQNDVLQYVISTVTVGARCSTVVRAFAHGAMGRRINPSWGGPIELFLIPASALRLV